MKEIVWFLFTVFRKIFGLFWYWVVFPFRAYARSVVQNYVLAKPNMKIKRLEERYPFPIGHVWVLQDVHNVGRNGKVLRRKVYGIEFWLVVFLIWGWLDDDSNHDTYDAGHCKRYTEHKLLNKGGMLGQWWRKSFGWLFRKQLLKAIEDSYYGNTFDLGDVRAEHPNFNFIAVLIWNTRNTAYNFYYLFGEK